MNYLNRLISLTLVTLICFCTCFSQIQDYQYKRQLKTDNNTWQSMTLPDEIYSRLNDELSDLRIIKIIGSDTIEIPYIPSYRFNTNEVNEQYFTLVNRTRSEEGYFYTYKVPAIITLNRIKIKTGLVNFDLRVTLEGSNDNLNWFTITGNYRISGFSNREASFSYTDIKFQDCEFRYYRLQVKTKDDPKINNVAFIKDEKIVKDSTNYEGITFSAENNKLRKQSVVEVLLPLKVPVSHIIANISTEGFYYRPFTLEYLVDSIKAPKGWVEQYNYSISGVLDSRTSNEYFLPEVLTNKFRLVVNNSDNQPLTFSSFEIRRINHWLLFKASKEGSYFLIYGNKSARIPDYDIAKIYEDGAPLPPTKEITIGKEETILIADTGKSATDEKLLLYSAMGVGLILLGFYLFRMIKQVK